MQAYIVVLLALFSISSYSQEQTRNKNNLQISLGYGIHSNSFNEGNYFDFKSTRHSDIGALNSITLKFSLPTKKEYLDMFFGAMVDYDRSSLGSTFWQYGRTNASEHYMNGGGIFAGLRIEGKIYRFN